MLMDSCHGMQGSFSGRTFHVLSKGVTKGAARVRSSISPYDLALYFVFPVLYSIMLIVFFSLT